MQTYLYNREQTMIAQGEGASGEGQEGRIAKENFSGWWMCSLMIFPLVYIYAKTYQIVYSKYGQFIECQLDLSKATIVLKHKFLFVIVCLISDSSNRLSDVMRVRELSHSVISPPVAGPRWAFSKHMANEKISG